MKNHDYNTNMPAELANRKAMTGWRSTSALYVRFAWLCCGVAGEVDTGLLVSVASFDVGAAEKEEPVRNVCVAMKSECDFVMAALGAATKNADAWL